MSNLNQPENKRKLPLIDAIIYGVMHLFFTAEWWRLATFVVVLLIIVTGLWIVKH